MRFARTYPVVVLALCLLGRRSTAQAHLKMVKEGYATTSVGIQIHYLESGAAISLPVLVLIPGWRQLASLWQDQLVKFSQNTRVIAIDPRSQGKSTKTSEGNTPESRARDLHDVLASLKVSQAVLVGWSQGAQDVAAYLQQFGTDSVAGVVFVDGPVSFGSAEVDVHAEFTKTILSNISIYTSHPQTFSEGMVRSLFKKPHPELNVPGLVKATLQTPTDTGIAMLVADMLGADRRPALAKLSVPALVLASEQRTRTWPSREWICDEFRDNEAQRPARVLKIMGHL